MEKRTGDQRESERASRVMADPEGDRGGRWLDDMDGGKDGYKKRKDEE